MSLTFAYSTSMKQKSAEIRAQIEPEIKSLDVLLGNCKKNEVCVFWFVGTNDLRKGSLDLMCSKKSKRIKKLIENGSRVYLIDLMAWNSFERDVNPTQFESKFKAIFQEFNQYGLFCLSASDFFKRLVQIQSPDLIKWIQAISERDALYLASKLIPENSRNVGDLLGGSALYKSLQSNKFMSQSLPKLYSLFQYLELFFYIEAMIKDEIVRSQSDDSGLELDIKFILPNNEYKYYLNFPENLDKSNGLFRQDLSSFLQVTGLMPKIKSLEISIQCFSYCQRISDNMRPYNAGSSLLEEPDALAPLIRQFDSLEIAKSKKGVKT